MKGIMVNPMAAQIKKAKETTSRVVKGALLIRRADKCQFGILKEELANNYLLGTDQYPNTTDKALRILGNYKIARGYVQYKASSNDMGVAFLQRGGQGGWVAGQGGQGAGCGDKNDESVAMSNNVSMMTSRT